MSRVAPGNIESDIRRFEMDLERFNKKLDVSLDRVVRRIAAGIFRRIAEGTPALSGRAVANWNIAVGSPNLSHDWDLTPGPDSGLEHALSKLRQVEGSISATDIIWITNTIYYSLFLEHGTPKIPARQMVGLTMANIESIIHDAISGV